MPAPQAPDWRELVQTLELQAHPEGGFYRETWRSAHSVDATSYGRPEAGSRSAATSILFLLPSGHESRLHRVASDELWLHQGGDPCLLSIGDSRHELGVAPCLQALVPAGVWQSAKCGEGAHGYTLVACIVVPGFEFQDFELA